MLFRPQPHIPIEASGSLQVRIELPSHRAHTGALCGGYVCDTFAYSSWSWLMPPTWKYERAGILIFACPIVSAFDRACMYSLCKRPISITFYLMTFNMRSLMKHNMNINRFSRDVPLFGAPGTGLLCPFMPWGSIKRIFPEYWTTAGQLGVLSEGSSMRLYKAWPIWACIHYEQFYFFVNEKKKKAIKRSFDRQTHFIWCVYG